MAPACTGARPSGPSRPGGPISGGHASTPQRCGLEITRIVTTLAWLKAQPGPARAGDRREGASQPGPPYPISVAKFGRIEISEIWSGPFRIPPANDPARGALALPVAKPICAQRAIRDHVRHPSKRVPREQGVPASGSRRLGPACSGTGPPRGAPSPSVCGRVVQSPRLMGACARQRPGLTSPPTRLVPSVAAGSPLPHSPL